MHQLLAVARCDGDADELMESFVLFAWPCMQTLKKNNQRPLYEALLKVKEGNQQGK